MSKRPRVSKNKKKRRTISQRRHTGPMADPHRLQEVMKQAAMAQRSGQLDSAAKLYEEALSINRNEHRALFGLAQIYARFDQTKKAVSLLEDVLRLRPDNFIYLTTIAEVYLADKQADRGLACAERAVKLKPDNHFALIMLATCLERFNRYEEALSYAKKAEEAATGDHPEVVLVCARMLRRNKRYDEAVTVLRAITQSSRMTPIIETGIYHELGLCLDKLGHYDEAFRSFETYSRIMSETPLAKRIGRDIAFNEIKQFREFTDHFHPPSWSADDFADQEEKAPAFLVGFPRSGTTMTEQIFAAHPGIITGDERPFLMATGEQAGKVLGAHPMSALDRFDIELVRTLRNYYWDQVRKNTDCDPRTTIFLDKLPLNIIHLVLINMIFPESKIIVALRDPRDVCLSCFMQNFTPNPSMIHFLSLEGSAKLYASVMDYYVFLRDTVSLAMIETRYEDTVSGLEKQAKKLLAHVGVEWDPAVLAFHEKAKERFISTPSFEAVTQPVHRGAIGRWKNYQAYFGPALPHLERFIEEFGYEHGS